MSITLEDKRLEALRRQLYGKEPAKLTLNTKSDIQTSSVALDTKDTNYLRTDLMKILLLSFFAIGVQIALFLASKNGLIAW